MIGWLATTDYDWFCHLRTLGAPEEVNFWQPSDSQAFHALQTGEPFFFKLKSPHNAVAGFGYFVRMSALPAWLAWDSFGPANGAPDFASMRARVERYRTGHFRDPAGNYQIGCRLLAQPVFFPDELWVRQPADWGKNIVQGKRYALESGEGRRIWESCQAAAAQLKRLLPLPSVRDGGPRYGSSQLVMPRLGQGGFRIAVIESYARACAVSSEHSLPALEAAHIKPYADEGEHRVSNGLLLRSDIHRLFDRGYVTVTPEHRIEISRRLQEDYHNGRSYRDFHGKVIALPEKRADHPDPEMLAWHNENRYLG